MDIFFNPNVAYLILVVGFLIAIMALLTPGTGLLEVGGLFLLLIAGWQIYNLNFNLIALIVLIVGVFPFLLALRKTGKWYHLMIALVALAGGSTFLFVSEGWHPAVNPFLAILVNLLLIGFFWIVIRKGLDAVTTPAQNKLKETVGSIGQTRSRVHKEGSVYLNGELWSAQSKNPIEENKRIRVLSRDGYILEVEEIPGPKKQE
jgi:membrane-bound serine protease (ClpP class)